MIRPLHNTHSEMSQVTINSQRSQRVINIDNIKMDDILAHSKEIRNKSERLLEEMKIKREEGGEKTKNTSSIDTLIQRRLEELQQ